MVNLIMWRQELLFLLSFITAQPAVLGPTTGGSIILIVTCSMETVNDGQFHTVELLTFNQKLNLSVDGGEPMTLDSQGRSQAATGEVPLYVGGEL